MKTLTKDRDDDDSSYNDVKPDMSVKDRYYNKNEYSRLSLAEKKGLKEKRKQRGKGKGGSDQPSKKKIKWDERTIKAITTEVASAMKSNEDEQGEPGPAPEPAQQDQTTGRSRTNGALRP